MNLEKVPEKAIVPAQIVNEQAVMTILSELFPQNIDETGFAFPNPLEIREKINALEEALLKAFSIQIQFQTTHRYVNGIYAREIFIPKGSVLTGKIHRKSSISVMNKGDITVLTESNVQRIKAPFATISGPGIKRAGVTHEDTIWTTFHAIKDFDLQKIEDELFVKDFKDADYSDAEVRTIVTMEGFKCQQQ